MRILGISAYYHDSAAALIQDGAVVSAAQEERFTRKRHDPGFPSNAVQFCLNYDGVKLSDIDWVAFYDKPFLKFERLLETYLAFAPRGFPSFRVALPLWVKDKLFQKSAIVRSLQQLDAGFDLNKLLFSEHHLSHAASAFYPSPFERAAILTMDGVGEWTTTSAALGEGSGIEVLKEIHFPHSLGLLYSAFTYYTGFKVNSGEYKLMGLAPYGVPRYANAIFDKLIDLKPDGSFRLDLSYFNYCTGLTMTSEKFHELFGAEPRRPDTLVTQREMDLAASIQVVTEEAVLRLANSISVETGAESLCLAGGVALNCVANGRLHRDGRFRRIWIQPAAGDAGGAIGAALAAYHLHLNGIRNVRQSDSMRGAFLGPEFPQSEIEERLRAAGAVFESVDDDALLERCAQALASGAALGWFQGRMEFGPRALGGRSILGDPRSAQMQSQLNLKVKYRESFRPFAPSVLYEDLEEWFDLDCESPYMMLVAGVAEGRRLPLSDADAALFGIARLNVPRSQIPAVTHVDYSARIQTVHQETNPRYYALLVKFKQLTGCPVLVNTSFNVRGEPIVCTPEDAFRCFMGTQIDALAIGNCFLSKASQTAPKGPDYRDQFETD